MIFRPRSTARLAYATIRRGVRCAETTVSSKGTSSSSSISAADFMMVRSLSLPIIMPTNAVLIDLLFTHHFQGVSDLMRFIHQVLFFPADNCHMAHFPSGLCIFLPIDMYKDMVHLQHFVQPFVKGFAFITVGAYQVDHR